MNDQENKGNTIRELERTVAKVAAARRMPALPVDYDPNVDPPLYKNPTTAEARSHFAETHVLPIVHRLNVCCSELYNAPKGRTKPEEHRCPGAYWSALSLRWYVCDCPCHHCEEDLERDSKRLGDSVEGKA